MNYAIRQTYVSFLWKSFAQQCNTKDLTVSAARLTISQRAQRLLAKLRVVSGFISSSRQPFWLDKEIYKCKGPLIDKTKTAKLMMAAPYELRRYTSTHYRQGLHCQSTYYIYKHRKRKLRLEPPNPPQRSQVITFS